MEKYRKIIPTFDENPITFFLGMILTPNFHRMRKTKFNEKSRTIIVSCHSFINLFYLFIYLTYIMTSSDKNADFGKNNDVIVNFFLENKSTYGTL